MGVTKRTINIAELVTGGGAQCSNPKIVWDQPLCAGIICELNDGKTIKVAIPDDCDEKCFWVTWYCNDYCNDCDPIRLKICPCDVDAECEACSKCDPVYNVCVSKCDNNEFCTDFDTCVECDETHPCTNGKQCVGGHCECPPEKPYTDSNGNCVVCTDDSCPAGQICTPDGCAPPICPEGVWNSSKMKCVECNVTGDCDPGECCNPITNACDCCLGFVRDPVTKQCVSAPCTSDGECPDCMHCQTGVGCVPNVCPTGKVCIPGQGCVDECNCNNPSCTKASAACVSYSATVCYCKDCAGSCANGLPCGDGCFCDPVDLQCKPKPCSNKSCVDGTECGNGCGCNPVTHMCEPCSSVPCGDDCTNLLGCNCPNGTNCADVNGCSGPCDGYGGCPLGCTCDGGQCVPCADFSCANNDCKSHPECKCNGTACEGDPDFCKDIFKTTNFKCGVTAELTLKNGCMCPGITVYATPHVISKGLIPAGSTEKTYLVSMALRLAKGVANNWDEIKGLHLLDQTQFDDIADNDVPTSGTVDLTLTEFYQPQVWVGGAWVNQGAPVSRVLPTSGSISFAGIARKENIKFTANKPGTGKNIIPGVSQEKVLRYEIGVKAGVLKFPNNCTYETKVLPVSVLDNGVFKSTTDSLDQLTGFVSYTDLFVNTPNGNYNLGGKFVTFDHVSSSSSRDPLMSWFRSEDNVYTQDDIIRKLYVNADSPGYYKDSLFGPANFIATKQNLVSPEGRVFGGMYYKVTNDCACNDKALDFGKLTWCSPDALTLQNVTLSLCNKKVVILSDIGRPCVTNWDLREFVLNTSDNTTAFKNKHQAQYHLIITLENGQVADIPYTWRESGVGSAGLYKVSDNTSIKTFTQTFNSPIVGLKMELRYGTTSNDVVCDWTKTIVSPTNHVPTYSKICEAGSNNIKYRFQLAANHISTISASGGTVVSGSGYKEIVATQGNLVTAYFTFTDYCPLTMELNEFCCDTLAVTMTVNQVDGNVELTSAVTGGTLPYSVKYYRSANPTDELAGESTNSTNGYKVVLTDPTPGLYFATVSDGSGNCSKDSSIVSIEPRNAVDYNIAITPTYTGCTYTGNVSFSIPNQPDIIGAKVYYQVNTAAEVYFTVTSLMVANGFNLVPAVGQTITLIRIEVPNESGPATVFPLTGSVAIPSNLSASIPVVNTFTLNGTTPSTNVCAGSDVLIELNGSPNAIVNILGIAPITIDGSGYGSSIQNPPTTTTYTITSITNSNGECPGTTGVGLTRQASITPLPVITVTSDDCDGSGRFRDIVFSNITSATDQLGNVLTVAGSTVTVDTTTVTEVRAVYVLGLCTATLTYIVTVCSAPEITGTVSGPSLVCAGDTATITVSGVTGGTAPYYYNYYTGANYNDTYTLGLTSKVILLASSDVVYVRVKDALDNMSPVGSVAVTVSPLPTPNIIPVTGTTGVTEVSTNVFEIDDNLTSVVFKTQDPYANYAWIVTGVYGGTTTGSGATFTIDVAQITYTIDLQVTVVSANGCVGTETVSIDVVAAPVILNADEMMFSTASYKLYKVQISTSAIGVPALLCGAGNPAYGITMSAAGDVIGKSSNGLGPAIFLIDVLGGCSNSLIGNFSNVAEGVGMITATKVVGQTTNKLQTYNLADDVVNTNHYTISDGSNNYSNATDIVKIGSFLYTICSQTTGATLIGNVLLRFTLDGSGGVTAFTNMGLLPNQPTSPVGLAYDGTDAYLIFGDGKTYNLNLTTPASSTLIGTIIVPTGEAILDTTNNY